MRHSILKSSTILAFSILALLLSISCSSSGSSPVNAGYDPPDIQNPSQTDNRINFLPVDEPERGSQIVWDLFNEAITEPNDTWEDAYVLFDLTDQLKRYPFKQHVGFVDSSTSDANDWFQLKFSDLSGYQARSIYVKLGWLGTEWLNVYIYDKDLNPVAYLNEDQGGGPKELWLYDVDKDKAPYYIRIRSAAGATEYYLKVAACLDYGGAWGDNELDPTNPAPKENEWWIDALPVTNSVDSVYDTDDYFRLYVSSNDDPFIRFIFDWLGSEDAELNLSFYDKYGQLVKTTTLNGLPKSFVVNTFELDDIDTYCYFGVHAVSGQAVFCIPIWYQEVYSDWGPAIFDNPPVIPSPGPPSPEPIFHWGARPEDDFPFTQVPQFPAFHF
ncbi:MAG TPA: hypothetical protein VGB30_03180 [bacterium]